MFPPWSWQYVPGRPGLQVRMAGRPRTRRRSWRVSGVRNPALRRRHYRRQDAAIRQDTKESLAAGVATIRRKQEHALQDEQGPLLDALPGDMLEIKIAALGAVCVPREKERHASRVEPEIAGVAAPGTQRGEAGEEIEDATATRTKAISASALRTDHSSRRLPSRARADMSQTCLAGYDLSHDDPIRRAGQDLRLRTIQQRRERDNPRCKISGERNRCPIIPPNTHAQESTPGFQARNMAESFPRLRNHDSFSRIHVDLPEDGPARLRRNRDSLRAEESLPGAESAENVPAGLSKSGNLLRECGEPHAARHRGSRPSRVVRGDRRIHASRRIGDDRRSALAAPPKSLIGAWGRLRCAARR